MNSYFFDREFLKSFVVSFSFHLLLIGISLLGGEIISRLFKSNDVEIIRSSIRVDVVGMPKFTLQELKQLEAKPIVSSEETKVVKGESQEAKIETEDVIKEGDLVIKEESQKKNSFLNLLTDYSNKEVAKKKKKKGLASGVPDKKIESLIIEGNRLSKGSALVGDYTNEVNSEFSSYVQNIPGVIRPFWKLPSYLMDKDLRCRIKIFLSNEGKLLKIELQESSGVAEFDARAEKAVREATFPKPSEAVGVRLTSSGIILGFPI